MKITFCLVMLTALFSARAINAQFGTAWQRSPAITVIYAEKDERIALVDEAVAFWNKTLAEIGSGFRLPKASVVKKVIPESDLEALSLSIVGTGPLPTPKSFNELPGDMNVFLAETEFVSFAGAFDEKGKKVVGIRGIKFPPFTMPNVARNVIIHEIGHAIGLGHNSDPAMLMCGRPSPCRPALFASPEAKIFPLTDQEKSQLRRMYPPDWKPTKQ